MKRKTILFILGTRPEAVKLCPLINTLLESKEFRIIVCSTGQHRQMLDQILKIFKVKTDYELDLMKPNQSIEDITTNSLNHISKVIEKSSPNFVIVQGDTTSAMTGALAAFYNKVSIGHIEAGLRTYNKYSPFPEEINRKIISVIADLHFAPTDGAKDNLLKEGVKPNSVFVTGNTVIDALYWVKNRVLRGKKQYEEFNNIDLSKQIVLVTGHRRENFGKDLRSICKALIIIANKYEHIQVVYPVHFNPNVWEPVHLLLKNIKNIHLIKPLDYEPFIYLMIKSKLIITDSGGVQEEAPSLGKPVIVTRSNTERPEGIVVGNVKLVGSNQDEIVVQTSKLIEDHIYYKQNSKPSNVYGDGHACERIKAVLKDIL
jgi:UDP-N-acetylglucosamine 2-epimerase (non-hydrolysing)